MTRSRFINVIIGASLAVMTGAYSLEFPEKEKKRRDIVVYVNGHPLRATMCEEEFNRLLTGVDFI